MSLNIKDPEADRWAHELAEYTGETITRAVKIAVKERLERVAKKSKKGLAEELLAIGRSYRKSMKGPPPIDHDEMLYDERGFFK